MSTSTAHSRARAIACPRKSCGAGPGECCRYDGTEGPKVARGGRRADHHPERVVAAGGADAPKSSAVIDPRVRRFNHDRKHTNGGTREGRRPDWYLENEPEPVDPATGAPRVDAYLHTDARSPISVTVTERALRSIEEHVAVAGVWGIETGGVLIGERHADTLRIVDAGTAGPNAKRTPTSLQRDHVHDLTTVDELRQWTAHNYLELAHWHLHPVGSAQPSDADVQHWATMAHILGTEYAGVIVTPPATRHAHVQLTAFVARLGDRNARHPWWRVEPAACAAG